MMPWTQSITVTATKNASISYTYKNAVFDYIHIEYFSIRLTANDDTGATPTGLYQVPVVVANPANPKDPSNFTLFLPLQWNSSQPSTTPSTTDTSYFLGGPVSIFLPRNREITVVCSLLRGPGFKSATLDGAMIGREFKP